MTQIGTTGNAWNAAIVGINGTSTFVDLLDAGTIQVFGNASAATTLTVQISQDSVNWTTHGTIAANGDFSQSYFFGMRYVQLKSSAAATITATVAAK